MFEHKSKQESVPLYSNEDDEICETHTNKADSLAEEQISAYVDKFIASVQAQAIRVRYDFFGNKNKAHNLSRIEYNLSQRKQDLIPEILDSFSNRDATDSSSLQEFTLKHLLGVKLRDNEPSIEDQLNWRGIFSNGEDAESYTNVRNAFESEGISNAGLKQNNR